MTLLINKQTVCLLLLVGFTALWTCPRGEAQLFKKGAQRRAERQSGGGMQQSQKGGLFGGRKNRQPPGQSSGSQNQQPKTGLFGRPKEQKEKKGLFGNARERREQEAYANRQSGNQYSPQRYTQQQMNQYASSNSVHRSQGVTSNQALFVQNLDTASGAGKPPAISASGSDTNTRPVASTTVQPRISEESEQLPDIAKRVNLPVRGESSAARAAAIVRSRPKLPQRTKQSGGPAQKYPILKNTSQQLPIAKPTGSLPGPNSGTETVDATLA